MTQEERIKYRRDALKNVSDSYNNKPIVSVCKTLYLTEDQLELFNRHGFTNFNASRIEIAKQSSDGYVGYKGGIHYYLFKAFI